MKKSYVILTVIGVAILFFVTSWVNIGNSLNNAQQDYEAQWSQVRISITVSSYR